MQRNITSVLNPNIDISTIPEEYIVQRKLADLTDKELVGYLISVLRTVSWWQEGDLLLLKYNNARWYTGRSNLIDTCRGKVVSIGRKEIVAYPFDKFYNVNEVEETRVEQVRNLIANSDELLCKDKKDGSAIVVTKYNGRVLVHTCGSFDNAQRDLAEKKCITEWRKLWMC